MLNSVRLFHCARCRGQVVICSHGDRGNIYCGRGCSQAARRDSRRRAGRRDQRSRRGRFAHAERQRRYRRRSAPKVTHQGSRQEVPDDLLDRESRVAVGWRRATSHGAPDPGRCGHFCGRRCSEFVRLDFIRRRGLPRLNRTLNPSLPPEPVRSG